MSDTDGPPSTSSAIEQKAVTPNSTITDSEGGRETPTSMEEDHGKVSREPEVGQQTWGNVSETNQPRSEFEDSLGTSGVYTACPRTMGPLQESEPVHKIHPLTLTWAFGMNKALPVFSLQDEGRLVILYAGAHVAVMYDHTSKSQRILQGHCSPVSCLCTSEDRRWLVTADRGSDSLVIIWDSCSGIPVRTLFDNHPEAGVAAVALSRDSKLLVTVGAAEIQRICIWDWTSEAETPLCVEEVAPEFGRQYHILFHPTDSNQLLSNSESHVLFHTQDQGHLEFSAHKISSKTFRREVGPFSQSVFLPSGVQAVTATLTGNLVVWDVPHGAAAQWPPSRKATKVIPVQKCGITVLVQIESFIVTGNLQGHVIIYDQQFKAVDWFTELSLGPVMSISFSKEEQCSAGRPSDLTLEPKPFTRKFLLSTADATVVHINPRGDPPQTLLRGHAEALHAVACHPHRPFVAMGSHCGLLAIWDYQQNELVYSRDFHEKRPITCLAYDGQGVYLAVGFTSGALEVMDTLTPEYQEKQLFKFSSDCITHLAFSLDSHYMATADAGNTVTIFQLCSTGDRKGWQYLGRHRSHYKNIRDLLFGVQPDSIQPRLFSLGMDRMLVEYDLLGSSEDNLRISSTKRIEQSAVPTCMAWYPPLNAESFLLTASDHYKMKLFNSTTKMCRKTLLGPTYGSPVKKIATLPVSSGGKLNSSYLACITHDMVVLQILPLDGNPHKSFAMICHPTGVSSFACSSDGKYIFTAGGVDCTLLSWETNLNVLEAVASLGGQGIEPFYGLLEGGRDGEFYKEMEDYFYYCQLLSQGIDTIEERQISMTIPLTEVPFMMRALGFFPTEQELEDIHNEVKFSQYAETQKYVTDVDLEEFIKLYINHRPAFGVSRTEIEHIFKVLGSPNENGEQYLNREDFLELLQTKGERMSEEELAEHFSTLLGLKTEGDGSDQESSHFADAEALVEHTVPAEVTEATLMVDILGFTHPSGEPMRSRVEEPPTGSPVSHAEV